MEPTGLGGGLLGTEDLFKWKNLPVPTGRPIPDTFEHYIKHIPGWHFKGAEREQQQQQSPPTQGQLVKVDMDTHGGSGQLASWIAAKDTEIGHYGYNDPPPHIEIRAVNPRIMAHAFSLSSKPLGLLDKSLQAEPAGKEKKKKKKDKKSKRGLEDAKKKKKSKRQRSGGHSMDLNI